MTPDTEPSRVAVIIPARGGSKGVPRKNLRPVGGVPLIGRAVTAALSARSAGSVWVSTEDPEIARVAADYGAEVISRPDEIAGDETASEEVLLHALDVLAARGEEPAVTVFVQCTAPLLIGDDIDGVVRQITHENADSAFAAGYFHGFVWERDAQGTARAVNHWAGKRERRQDRAPQYLEAGSVYAFRTDGFRREKRRFFGRVALHEIVRERCWEIDDEADLRVADCLLQPDARLVTRGAR